MRGQFTGIVPGSTATTAPRPYAQIATNHAARRCSHMAMARAFKRSGNCTSCVRAYVDAARVAHYQYLGARQAQRAQDARAIDDKLCRPPGDSTPRGAPR